jgi:Tfp pilus assembly major pilin PilA
VIIPIVGILAAVAIPAYQGYVDKAEQVQIQQDK